MEAEIFEKLVGELRGQVNDLAAAAQLLTPLVTRHGGEKDLEHLAAINKDLYQLIRTIRHLELCGEEEPAFRPQTIDVAGLCRDIGRQTEAMAEELEVDFDWKLEKESVLSLADEGLLVQAILNQLTNAFAAAGKGGWVKLRCAVSGSWVKIVVSDSGPGLKLPPEDVNPLLKREGGLGLGLAAARKAAALHGGALMLENAENAGVRSVLSLPIRTPESGQVRQGNPPYDRFGGFSPLLVEFSPLLGEKCFLPEELE